MVAKVNEAINDYQAAKKLIIEYVIQSTERQKDQKLKMIKVYIFYDD